MVALGDFAPSPLAVVIPLSTSGSIINAKQTNRIATQTRMAISKRNTETIGGRNILEKTLIIETNCNRERADSRDKQ